MVLWVVFVAVLMGFCVCEHMHVVFADVQTSPLYVHLTVRYSLPLGCTPMFAQSGVMCAFSNEAFTIMYGCLLEGK